MLFDWGRLAFYAFRRRRNSSLCFSSKENCFRFAHPVEAAEAWRLRLGSLDTWRLGGFVYWCVGSLSPGLPSFGLQVIKKAMVVTTVRRTLRKRLAPDTRLQDSRFQDSRFQVESAGIRGESLTRDSRFQDSRFQVSRFQDPRFEAFKIQDFKSELRAFEEQG